MSDAVLNKGPTLWLQGVGMVCCEECEGGGEGLGFVGANQLFLCCMMETGRPFQPLAVESPSSVKEVHVLAKLYHSVPPTLRLRYPMSAGSR